VPDSQFAVDRQTQKVQYEQKNKAGIQTRARSGSMSRIALVDDDISSEPLGARFVVGMPI